MRLRLGGRRLVWAHRGRGAGRWPSWMRDMWFVRRSGVGKVRRGEGGANAGLEISIVG